MDDPTIQYYEEYADELTQQYATVVSSIAQFFAVAFATGSKVLDVGCGSGRDLQALLQSGFQAEGIDASTEMLAQARARYPAVAGRLRQAALPELDGVADASYDGLLCSAVLMHLPEERLFDTVYNLRRVLRQGGRLLISTPVVEPTIKVSLITSPLQGRDERGRLFNGVTPENFQFLFEKVGFRRINRWDTDDSLGRPDRRWATQLFVLENHGSRSLDRIESILNRDKKNTTYKPALFRALAEIATMHYHQAIWLPGGEVAIDIGLIRDKWIEYYWPLMEKAELFIPQQRGETSSSSKQLAFRSELEALARYYQMDGGLSGYTIARRSGTIPRDGEALLKRLRAKVADSIRDGPVKHSGGEGSNTFRYDSKTQRVIMDADLWRELSIMGGWIADATVLRWAELTAEIAQGALKPSQVIDQLLQTPIAERDVHGARSVYAGLHDKVCVWTDRSLKADFDVDHAIPFALWKNNDLWNLFPAHPVVNNAKRDKLPALELLKKRRDCIIHYWEAVRERHPIRFDFEAEKLMGSGRRTGGNWENRLFSVLAEAVEVTALQRGVERWQPSEAAVTPAGMPLPIATPIDSADRNIAKSDPQPVSIRSVLVDFPPEGEEQNYVPFYDVAAAASPPTEGSEAAAPSHYLDVRALGYAGRMKGLFATRVRGRSMLPMIPEEAVCLFRQTNIHVAGKVLLIQSRSFDDPDTGGDVMVKRYSSRKVDGRKIISLESDNAEIPPIIFDEAEEPDLNVIGEFIAVLPGLR